MEMKKLVVNGVAYTVADPDAACIDDTKVGGDAWSGKHIADRLCPGFSVSGSAAVCTPLEGYPLSVVSKIAPVQEGSGDPAPASWNAVVGMTIYAVSSAALETDVLESGKTYRLVVNAANAAGERVKLVEGCEVMANDEHGFPYLDVTVGDYYLEFTMRGDYSAVCNLYYEGAVEESSVFNMDKNSGDLTLKEGVFTLQEYDPGNVRPITGHSAVTLTRNGEEFTMELGQTVWGGSLDWGRGLMTVTHGVIDSYAGEAVPEGWLSDTGALSQGAQVVYPLEEPVTVRLAPQEILALSGANTLYSDTGDTQVTGRADPVAVLTGLLDRVAALEVAANA